MKTKLKKYKHYLLIFTVLISQSIDGQVIPGAGGSLPSFTAFTPDSNKIGGFYISKNCRENNSFGGGTRAVTDMSFPLPSEFGGTSYTLQVSSDSGATWTNYQYFGADLTTTGDNFSLNLAVDYKLRLLLNGGSKDGYTSNEAYAHLSSIDTRFSGWGLDESMFLSGTIAPYAGRGLQASFTVKKLMDESDIIGSLSYQWYRVNPVTFEMIAVAGDTNLSYTTTIDDAGYLLLIKATGDETTVGGFSQVFSTFKTIIPNGTSVSNSTNSGFTLNLDKSISGLSVEDLVLLDKNYDTVTITSVTQGTNSAIYHVDATLDDSKAPYMVSNNSDFWRIVSAGQMMGQMEGVEFNLGLPSGVEDLRINEISIYPVPTQNVLNVEMNSRMNGVSVLDIRGKVLLYAELNDVKGNINTSELSSGVYFLSIDTDQGVIKKRFTVLN